MVSPGNEYTYLYIYVMVVSEALSKLWKQRFDFGGVMSSHEESK